MNAILHPNLAAIHAHAAARGAAPADPLATDLDTARRAAREYQAIWNEDPPALAAVLDRDIPGPRGARMPIRVFLPQSPPEAGLPVLLYFHGGGFVLNGLDTHDRLMRLLALRSGVAVVGLGYGLAPELRFPGQIDQALATVAWLRRHGAELGLNAGALALGGDSAGAALALSTMLAQRDLGLALPRLGLLFYGMFSADLATPSHRAFGGGAFGLTSARVDWFWSQYLADRAQRDNPLAAPLLADLHDLPPQWIVGAGLDCLLDDSLRLAERLRQAGGTATLSVAEGVPHSFLQMSAVLEPADRAIAEAAAFLRDALTPPRC